MHIAKNLFLVTFLITLNLGISLLVQSFNLFYVINSAQETFRFGYWSMIVIPILWLMLAHYLKIYNRYNLIFVVILAGLVSNILERLITGFVVDYFNFGVGVANLADLQIYCGLIYIIIQNINYPHLHKISDN